MYDEPVVCWIYDACLDTADSGAANRLETAQDVVNSPRLATESSMEPEGSSASFSTLEKRAFRLGVGRPV